MTDCDICPLVSVIVPIYNAEKYLDICVESIVRQTLHNIEIILVDDGSPDRCPQMCDDYAAADSRIIVIHKKNGGPGIARNAGLAIARGKWVCFVDSDDFIALNTLEVSVMIGEKSGAEQVRFLFNTVPYSYGRSLSAVNVDDKLGVISKSFDEKVNPILEAVTNMPFGARVKTTDSACTAIFRRDMLVCNNLVFCPEDEIIVEDYAFILEVAPMCSSIAYTNNRFYYYRDTPCSRSKFRPDRMDRSAEISLYLEHNLPKYGYKNVSLIGAAVMLGYLRNYLREIYGSDLTDKEKRQAHHKAVNHSYIQKIIERKDYKRLPMMQRLAFYVRDSYTISRVLTCGRDWLRAVVKK